MEKIILLFSLFFSISFYAQNDTISSGKKLNLIVEPAEVNRVIYNELNNLISDSIKSNITVVSADKLNILYRGLSNPISIAVPNNYEYSVAAPGLFKDGNGKYFINPSSGTEVNIIIKYQKNNTESVAEKHTFRIKNLPSLSGAINGLTCKQSILLMSKKELAEAILSIDFTKEFLYDLKFNLVSFAIKINTKIFYIKGNQINSEALKLINKLPINSIFEIYDFKSDINCTNCSMINIRPLKIMVVDDEGNYEKE